MSDTARLRVPIFPLAGALLFPGSQLPLHIFEPRYRAMVRDALASDGLIAMVQPRDEEEPPALFTIGCIGRIAACDELDDGRFLMVLGGEMRVRIVDEYAPERPYRLNDVEVDPKGPSIFEALERQLGLRLQATQVEAEVLVVDTVLAPRTD